MSEDKRAALNAKRRENYHRKKAELLAASGINVTILLWRTCTKGILMLLTVFVMSRCFTRGCRAVTDSAIWTVGGIFDPRWRYTWIKRCRSVIYSHDWTVSGIFKPGRSDKRLVFVFLCRALIMDIFRKYNMRVWCLFRVCIGKGVPSMLATAENSPLINLTGLSTVSTNHAQDSPTNKILTPKG